MIILSMLQQITLNFYFLKLLINIVLIRWGSRLILHP